MKYGIATSNGMEGFFSSERQNLVVFARGVNTYTTYPSWGYGVQDNRPLQILVPIKCTKFFARSMMYNHVLPNGSNYNARVSQDLRLYVGTDSGRTGAVVGFTRYDDNWAPNNISGRINPTWSETDQYITLWVALSAGAEGYWTLGKNSRVTEKVYVLICGNLPEGNHKQQISKYGILLKNSAGNITFNSSYMPFNPAAYIRPQGVPSTWASLPAMSSTGVEGKFLLPADFSTAGISRANFDDRFYCEMRTILSTDGKRYGTRIGGWASSPPKSMPSTNYITSGYNRLPLLRVSDYFP